MWSIRNTQFFHEKFTTIEAEDVRASNVAYADAGRVLPYHDPNGNEVFVYLFADEVNFFFNTFSEEEVKKADPDTPIGKVVAAPMLKKAFLGVSGRGAREEDMVRCEAWWVQEEGEIVGIKLLAKTATCSSPAETICYFSYPSDSPTPVPNRIVTVSHPLFGEKRIPTALSVAYPTIPTIGPLIKSSTPFPMPIPRPEDTFSPIYTDPEQFTVDLVKKNGFGPPMMNVDRLVAEITVLALVDEVEVEKIECRWKMRNSEEGWELVPCDAHEVERVGFAAPVKHQLPKQLSKSRKGDFVVMIDFERMEGLASNWRSVFWKARNGPVLFELAIYTKKSTASILLEHCITSETAFHPPLRTEETLSLFSIDDDKTMNRYWIHLTTPPTPSFTSGPVILSNLNNADITVTDLREAVCRSEADPSLGGIVKIAEAGPNKGFGWRVFGMIDAGCRRVYALRWEVYTETGEAVEWVLVPEYGDAVAPTEVLRTVPAGTPLEGLEDVVKKLESGSDLTEFSRWVEPVLFEQLRGKFSRRELVPPVSEEEMVSIVTGLASDDAVGQRLAAMESRLAIMERALKSADTKVLQVLTKLDSLGSTLPHNLNEKSHTSSLMTTDEKLDAIQDHLSNLPIMIHKTVEAALDSHAEVISALVRAAIESRMSQYDDGMESRRRAHEDGARTVMGVPATIGNGIVAGVSGVGSGLVAGVSGVGSGLVAG
ncbi:hypothetical protein HDU67_002352, partial [Dinochytrium kinnereticum]